MKQAFILHGVCDEDEYFEVGGMSPANSHWLPWLREMFEGEGFKAECLEMPVPYKPNYEDWCAVWERFRPDQDTILVGHSAGGGFFLKWMSENPDVRGGKVVLVAPWLDPERECGAFLNGHLDPQLMSRIRELHILVSMDDPVEGVDATVEYLQMVYAEAHVHRFDNLRHFCLSDTGPEFAVLWDICR